MRDLSVKNIEYREVGFAVVDDLADAKAAAMVRDLFESSDYDYTIQTRRHHYSHVFKSNDPELPAEGEVFSSRFFRSAAIERNDLIRDLVETYIRPCVSDVARLDCNGNFNLRAYRLDAGDHFRSHVDDYAGSVGFIYYLSTDWKWDWGGILHVKVNGQIRSSVPAYNRLVVVNHSLRLPHFVSPVADYALQSRFMLVGLLP
jgi:Rps23 Pro-64 3,4-dihydroxylase Tpa1-like proline 4-hydroxylase